MKNVNYKSKGNINLKMISRASVPVPLNMNTLVDLKRPMSVWLYYVHGGKLL